MNLNDFNRIGKKEVENIETSKRGIEKGRGYQMEIEQTHLRNMLQNQRLV